MLTELMPWLVWTLCVVCIVVGFLGTIAPILPGAPLIFLGILIAAWWEDFSRISVLTVVIAGVFASLAIVVDLVASYVGAKRVGASKAALFGSIVGSLVGMFFLLPGLIVGPFIGALAGEWWSAQNLSRATRVGLGTWLGMIVGTAAKIGLSLTMIGIFLLAILS
jgi:uncharacterized protein YqgC (DUF456 family)